MMDLSKSGIMEGISEVIATTKSGAEGYNAAPIGVIREGEATYSRIYPNTHTYANISSNGTMIANLTKDPELFVLAAFGDLSPDYYANFHGYPAIKDAEAWVLFSCRIIKNPDPSHYINYSEVSLEPISSKVNNRELRAINRALNGVIEATIHATRYLITGDKKLKESIDYYDKLVSTCGGPDEKRAMELLYQFLDEKNRLKL
ncbi:MAG: DUF447 family protein [Halobacteriota archaeon]|nr:DUF447 family protein [Halobacteriota archaeon]